MILNTQQQELISKKLENLENLTTVNFTLYFTKFSGEYKFETLMVAIFCTFLISFLSIIFYFVSAIQLIQLQSIIFFTIYLFFINFNDLLKKILPKSYKNIIASKNARNQFYNIKRDNSNNCLMLFISFDEKYIEIIADDGITKEIPLSHWQNIIDEFATNIKDGELLVAYEKAIIACNSILIEKFPINKDEQK